MNNNRNPAVAFPPGEFLRDEIEARGWTQGEFADIIGRSSRLVNELITAKIGLSPETARLLESALGISAQYWLNLESAYKLYRLGLTPTHDRISREASLRERYPVREMIKRGWIEESDSIDVLESSVRNLLHLDSLEATPYFPAAAKQNSYSSPIMQHVVWLARVRQLAETQHLAPYSESKLINSLARLRELVVEPESVRHVPRILAEAGVHFVIVEPLPQSRIDGACFWIDDDRSPVIGMTLRFDRIDNFWFVLRHEIEHVLRKDGQRRAVIDDLEPEKGSVTEDELPEEEIAANNAASNFCVPEDALHNFMTRVGPYYSETTVIGFARRIGVHPGLVVGQLQRKLHKYSLLRKYLIKVRSFLTESALTDGFGHVGSTLI